MTAATRVACCDRCGNGAVSWRCGVGRSESGAGKRWTYPEAMPTDVESEAHQNERARTARDSGRGEREREGYRKGEMAANSHGDGTNGSTTDWNDSLYQYMNETLRRKRQPAYSKAGKPSSVPPAPHDLHSRSLVPY